MPRLEIDLLNTELIKDTLTILQELLNDDRLPNDMYLEYGKKFERIWNKKENGANTFSNRFKSGIKITVVICNCECRIEKSKTRLKEITTIRPVWLRINIKEKTKLT